MGIAGGSTRGAVAGRSVPVLVEGGLANNDSAHSPEPDGDVRILLGEAAERRAGAARRIYAIHVDEVLDRHRDAVERAAIQTCRQFLVGDARSAVAQVLGRDGALEVGDGLVLCPNSGVVGDDRALAGH